MNLPIVRMYASPEQAKLAVERLRRWGFEQELINLVTASSTPPANAPASAASDDPVLSSILSGYVLKAHAKVYAAEVHQGRAMVAIRPPFGTGGIAEELMDECNPVKSALVIEQRDPMPMWDEAAPFSSAFGLPVLVRATAPFSAFWVLPVVTRRLKSLGAALGIPEVIRSSWYLFGEPKLSRSATPLSSMLGLPLLKR
jgi:hypothetical protein